MRHPKPDNPKQLVAYYRVSTQRQGESGLGLDAQRQAVRSHAKREGCTVAAEYTEIESGRKADRPQLRAALGEVARRGGTLVVAKLDRLTRNVAFLSSIHTSGVRFVACDFPQANKLLMQILAAVAEWEVEMIRRRIMDAMAIRRQRGERMGMNRPDLRRANMKYQRLRRRLAAEFRKQIRVVIAPYRDRGLTLFEVAAALNAKGIHTRFGKPWRVATVCKAMTRKP